jgi:hypothetical protein
MKKILIIAVLLICNLAYAKPQYRGFMLGDTSLQSLSDAKALGVNIFRHQIFVSHMNEQNKESVMNDVFTVLDPIVNFCLTNNVKLVIDLHQPPGGMKQISHNRSDSAHFWDRKLQNLVIFFWKRISERYSNNSILYGYDLLNEPAYRLQQCKHCYTLNGLYLKLKKEIRKFDTQTDIILESSFGKSSTLKFLKPLKDDRVIYSIHWYSPMKITHQTLFNFSELIEYPNKEYNKNVLKSEMRTAINFQKRYNARMYIGEFSCIRWAKNSSAKFYIRDVISIFEKLGWDWSYHAWREYDGWSPEHNSDMNDKGWKSTTPVLEILKKHFSLN